MESLFFVFFFQVWTKVFPKRGPSFAPPCIIEFMSSAMRIRNSCAANVKYGNTCHTANTGWASVPRNSVSSEPKQSTGSSK